jgi:hypothetical protein
MMEAIPSSESLVPTRTTWNHIQGDGFFFSENWFIQNYAAESCRKLPFSEWRGNKVSMTLRDVSCEDGKQIHVA